MRFLFAVLLCALAQSCQKPLPQPDPVELLSPADEAVLNVRSVAFSWLAGTGVAAYELQAATDPKFASPVADNTFVPATGDTVTLAVDVGPDDRYYWRVRARNADGVWSDWSPSRWFELQRYRVVASVKTQGYPHDVEVTGGRAYIADGQAGLAVFDVSNPESPALLGVKMDSMNVAWGVAVAGSYAYVSYGTKELYIVDVSRPESLRVAGELEYPQPGYGYNAAIKDTLAFLAADAQFIIVNVAQPAYPNLVFQYRYPRDCRDVAVSGSYCYVACGQLGVAVWKIESLPPRQVASFDTPANALSVAVAGSYLYVADTRNGLIAVDVSDPLNPLPVATLALSGYARHVTVLDTMAYVSCEDGGLAIVNVARPDIPKLVSVVRLSYPMCAQADGGYVFVGDRDLGLVVLRQEE
jgi:hypothetical protein